MSGAKLTHEDVREILKMIESAEHVVDFSLKYGDVELRLSRNDASPEQMPAPEIGRAHV